MIIEGLISIALLLVETEVPEFTCPDPPPIVCYEEGGELTCHPIDPQEKDYR